MSWMTWMSIDSPDDPWCSWMSWMSTVAQVDRGCIPMLKLTRGAAGCLRCQLMLKMTLDVAGCHGCLFMHLDVPWWTWLHLDVAGCTLMYLVAARCPCFKLGGNLDPWCTWMVFDANLLICHKKITPFWLHETPLPITGQWVTDNVSIKLYMLNNQILRLKIGLRGWKNFHKAGYIAVRASKSAEGGEEESGGHPSSKKCRRPPWCEQAEMVGISTSTSVQYLIGGK